MPDDEAVEVADACTADDDSRFVETVLELGRPLENVGISGVVITLDSVGIKEDV